MKQIKLYNLHIGEKRPPEEFSNHPVGPFTVKVVDDYENRIKKLYKKPTKTTDILGINTIYEPESPSGWAVTAIAEYDEKSIISEKSILCREDIWDGGLWDLCTILTFLTGRRVVSEKDHRERYNPTVYGERSCIGIETLRAAAIAWNNRHNLKSKKIVYSLLSLNEALSHDTVQAIAAFNNTALNIILDQEVGEKDKIDKKIKTQLKDKINEVIEKFDLLTSKQKKAYSALIGAKVDQGTNSLFEKLENLLLQYEIIKEPIETDIKNRIRYINSARNKLTHAGELPDLKKGLTQEQSDNYSLNIISGIVPDLCRLIIGRHFGFTRHTAGSLCQQVINFQKFFEKGIWNDWKLEEQSFDEYWYE